MAINLYMNIFFKTGYTLMYEKKGEVITRVTVRLLPSDLQYRIVNLTAETMYTIYLHASTRVGPGPSRSADVESGVEPGMCFLGV